MEPLLQRSLPLAVRNVKPLICSAVFPKSFRLNASIAKTSSISLKPAITGWQTASRRAYHQDNYNRKQNNPNPKNNQDSIKNEGYWDHPEGYDGYEGYYPGYGYGKYRGFGRWRYNSGPWAMMNNPWFSRHYRTPYGPYYYSHHGPPFGRPYGPWGFFRFVFFAMVIWFGFNAARHFRHDHHDEMCRVRSGLHQERPKDF